MKVVERRIAVDEVRYGWTIVHVPDAIGLGDKGRGEDGAGGGEGEGEVVRRTGPGCIVYKRKESSKGNVPWYPYLRRVFGWRKRATSELRLGWFQDGEGRGKDR